MSAAPARAPKNRLSEADVDRIIGRLRAGMQRLADNASLTKMPDRILLREELREFLPVNDSTVARWMSDPKMNFPQSFSVSGRLKGWSLAELLGWYLRLLESRDQQGGAS